MIRKQIADIDVAEAEAYWRRTLRGFTAPTPLPADRGGPGAPEGGPGFVEVKLPDELTAQLQALDRQHQLTMESVVQGAWALLLSRYSGEPEIVFGAAVCGRPADFAAALPLRVTVPPDAGLLPWLAGIQEQQTELHRFACASLEQVQSWSDVTGGQALFESTVALAREAGDAVLHERPVSPITVVALPGRSLTLRIRYQTERFTAAAATRMLGHLQTVLGAMAADPDQPVGALPLLTAAEWQQIVYEWNDTAVAYRQGVCLHQLIEEQVERTPDAAAVVFAGERLSYRDLNRRANQVAHRLRSLGVGPDVMVGICMERSLEMVVGLLGILKAGGAYVPLDPSYPQERLAFMVADAEVPVLLTQERLLAVLPEHGARVICLDGSWAEIAGESHANPMSGAGPENTAYVIFTSGSTGRPKGVMVPHAGIVNRLLWMQEEYRLTPADRVMQKTPFSFDVSVWEFFWPLMTGAGLVVAQPEGHKDSHYLVKLIREEQITTMHFVPSMLQVFTEEPGLEACESLRQVMCSGEALPADLVERFYGRAPAHVLLHNLYGPTEASVDVTYWACPRDGKVESVPIGRPVANTQMYVLDGQLRPVPVGVAGELHIGGVQLAKGYLKRPDLTAEKFIPNPFGAGRVYKTGDLARYREDGAIEYLGRIDHQVKIRGFRIELGEIEAALAQHGGVQETVVVAREDVPGQKQLVAYVVPAAGPVPAAELREFLQAGLPEYMVPAHFVTLEAMPLSPNGKLDRKALPAPTFKEEDASYIPPGTPMEETLAGLWCQVFGLPRVGIHTNFFELGGHSLLATQIISRLRKLCQIDLTVRDLFAAPTIAAFARRVEQARLGAGAPEVPPLAPAPRDGGPLPLSYAQQRLWFLEQLEPGRPIYNLVEAIRFEGVLDCDRLQASLNGIVARHEALRTTFAVVGGEPVQVIAPKLTLELPVTDLSGLAPEERTAAVTRLTTAEARKPFDLQRGPLIRAMLLRLAEHEHILVLGLHHIVSDGWSHGVLLNELAALYEGQPLADLPVQYGDVALWQRRWLQGEALSQQLAYWKQQLAGSPPLLELPTDRPRPRVNRFEGAMERIRFPRELLDGLQALSRSRQVTLFMTLLAGFQVLLHRYSRQAEVCVGTPVANRNQEALEGLIGFFVNTLVMRANVGGNPTFTELLQQVGETALGAYSHQDVPFEQVVEALQPERSLSYTPLFQVMFALQNAPVPSPAGLSLSRMTVDRGTSQFDLTLSMEETAEGLLGELEYNSALFDRATVLRMMEHYQNLLQAAVANPETPVAHLPLLGAAEQHRVLVEWNPPQTSVDERRVHERFEDQVSATPDALALVCGDERLTYRELNERANRLAHGLRKRGVSRNVLVGICAERSAAMVVALLSVLKAGGAYVPLDPNYPRERLAFMLADTQVPVLLTQAHLVGRLPEHGAQVICLDGDPEPAAQESTANPAPTGSADDLAYVIYTSGSTGKPKGVLLHHRGLSNVVTDAARRYALGPASRVLQVISFSFDPSVLQVFMTLTTGATLYVARDSLVQNGAALAAYVEEHGITVLETAPALLTALPADAMLPSLQVLAVGGDRCPEEVVDRLAPGRRMINAYGPTETTIAALYGEYTRGERRAIIGRPLANTQVYVLDEYRQPVPAGVAGELYIGGAGVAHGYLNRPKLTAERFVPNPFGEGRLYATGDLVRHLPDGTVEFLGRVDTQVKIRGFRVELAEIEATLMRHPAVREAVVLAPEVAPGDKRLVAYLVPHGAQVPARRELRAFLKETLPAHMVPAAFVTLEALPLSANGKVDRKAMPAPAMAELLASEGYTAPRTPLEEQLAGVWAEVLRLPRVGVHDDFFEAGGHSLLAARLVARLQEELGVEVPLRRLFEAPTVADLAEALEGAAEEPAAEEQAVPTVTPLQRDRTPSLSFAQQRLWFLEQMEGASAVYNIPGAFRLVGPLRPDLLARAVNEVVRRHESLRTHFASVDGEPVQVIEDELTLALPVIDLTGRPDREDEARRLIAADAAQPFDLSAGSLLRVSLLKLGAEEYVLLFCMHHIVSDGWSMGVFIRELAKLYAAFLQGAEPALPALPVQYADYAQWHRSLLSGELRERQLRYWQERLAGAPAVLELPTDRPRPAVRTTRGAVLRTVLPKSLANGLKELSRREGSTMFMTLLAAFHVLLYRYTGQSDICVGAPAANRKRPQFEGLIGFFVNTLVLRTEFAGDESFRTLVSRVRQTVLGALAHEDLPFEQLVEAVQPERSLSHSPLFQVMFALQNHLGEQLQLPGLSIDPLETHSGTSQFDLGLSLEETAEGLAADLEYNTDLFDGVTIERMIQHFQTLLEGIVADPGRPVGALPLMTEAERTQVVAQAQGEVRPLPMGQYVPDLVEAAAARAPEGLAVTDGTERFTYGELNRRANQLAAYLQSLGVGPETLVATCLDRSAVQVMALLAVLKAGAAYVPMDPAYPKERLSYILEDTAAPVVLTVSALRTQVATPGVQVICLDTDWAVIAAYSDENPVRSLSAGSLAYVIYTSGSTGKPKGVLVEHGGLLNTVEWHRQWFGVSAADRKTLVAGPAFDAAVAEIWPYLTAGASLHVPDREHRDDPERLRDWLVREAITVSFQPTPLAEVLLGLPWPEQAALRWMLAAGDKLHRHPPAGLPFRLANCYGPTENTVVATACAVEPTDRVDAVPSIGRPVSNVNIYVLDGNLQLVPVGVPGELCIGGRSLARGYLNRPELTAERFIEHPACGRLYRTGDRARYLADGNLEFIGRVDNQVKIRGFRIELGEIETVINSHPAVRESVVIAREERPGQKRLAAYVVPEGAVTADDLRTYLKDRLPEYMVPAAFMLLEQLPLTPNGKVDRRALPAPAFTAEAENYTAPRTQAEEVLAAIWAEVLGLPQVGVHDNFFTLGGHSLLAAQVISRIRRHLAVELPVRALFEGPTVAELSERVDALRRDGALPKAPPVAPVSREGELALSFAQQRLWLVDQMEPGKATYNVPVALRLRGALDADALERSLTEIVRRHEALRTVFADQGGQPVQVIREAGPFPIAVTALDSLPEGAREEQVRQLARAEAGRPFDLAEGPLMRAGLLRLSATEHVLLLTMHHIVFDGWSVGVLLRELTALYAAYAAGQPSPLPELAVQYADFAAWQRQWLQGEVLESHLAYWKEQLAGLPPVLELPTDRARPPVQTFNGAYLPVVLPAVLTERLKGLSRQEGVTLFMTLLAAFQTLVHRYSGQADISVGTPVANRNRSEIEGLIGFFVNTLVLRSQMTEAQPFRELLGQVREKMLGAQAHQDLPFEQLVEAVQPERSLSHSPLFQVMFTLQNAPAGVAELPGLTLEMLETENATAKFDLTMALEETAQGLTGTVEYNTDLFDAATIERLIGHFRTLLEGVVADPGQPVGVLPLMTDAERAQVVSAWNQTGTDYPRDLSIHQLFETQVQQTPGAVAVVFGGEQLTYGELNARANRLAAHLRQLGVKPDMLVGLCLERSLNLVVALLAILKAGGAYLPLDASYPKERLTFMLEDGSVSVLLTERTVLEKLPEHGAQVVLLDELQPAWTAESPENQPSPVGALNPAYVNYTSGSTGRPKGVLVPHRAVVRLVKETNFIQIGPDAVFLQFAPVSFDAATLEVWGPLLNGGRLVVMAPGTPSLGELGRTIREHHVTTLWLTASLFHLMVDEHLDDLKSVRQLLAGGDVLSVAHVRKALAGLENGTLINGYGPTENTTFTCCYPMTRETVLGHTVPIGRPIANTQVYVLDGQLQPVPVGVPGELWAGGDGLALGYLNQPELTAERFIEHAVYGRLYRTGDLVRHLPDGNIEFIGRVDNQVKIRGFRIELGEIETALGHHPAVRESVVMVREDQPGQKRLVAYVVPEGALTVEELRNSLKERLPEYMVPGAFMVLERLPVTPNGKVDRRALPAPEIAADEEAYAAPRTQAEEVLAAIWAQVLGLQRVSIHDNFFALGGHSLLATQVVSRIRQHLAVELPLRALFEAPTVAELSERVETLRRDGMSVKAPPITPVRREGEPALSFAQQRLWVVDQMEPGKAAYNVPVVLRLRGALDAGVLERSLAEIVRRHEALRTVFANRNGQPVQVIREAGPFPLPVRALDSLAEAEREEQVRRLAQAEVTRPFDLARGPLVRAELLRLNPSDHALLLTMHHIVSDGWSVGVLMRELTALYAAYAAGQPSPLPELAVQYADFAAWQRQWLQGEVLESHLAYWKEQLAGLPPVLELPTDRPRPPVQTFNGAHMLMNLPAELTERLKGLSRQEGVTLFMTLLAAFQTLLHRYSGQADISVGTPVANRNRSEIEGLIGFFVNTLVLRSQLSGEQPFRELLRQVREKMLGAQAHQDLPFEQLVEAVQPERSLSHSPLFQVMFALQNAPAGVAELPGLTMETLEAENATAKFDLTLSLEETAQGLAGAVEYNTDLFDASTIERMIGHFQTLLEAVAANPDARVGALPLLTKAERHQVGSYAQGEVRPLSLERCVTDLVEAQAARAPEALAVAGGAKRLTYGELNRQANQLAHYLQSLGAGPETLVATCLERSPEQVVALLAVLKAGAAYVPMDPTYPEDRLNYMLEDTGAPVLLTVSALLSQFAADGVRVICLDTDWERVAACSEANPTRDLSAGNLAYVIYTSGSTGRPKGVQVEHAALLNLVHWHQQAFAITAADRATLVAGPGFDAAVWELWPHLTAGASIHIPGAENREEPERLRDWLVSEAITVSFLPTPLAEAVLGLPWPWKTALRYLLAGGDKLHRHPQAGLPFVLVNNYGPTENTVVATACPVAPADRADAVPPIGRPITNVTAYILDGNCEPVPVGVPGELYIGGRSLARGYLNRPELTAERFIAHAVYGRLYRTGDLVRYLPDGNIEFIGRADNQVKIRGFRIELGEIETVIGQHPGVREAAVTVREDQPGQKRLAAYVVPEGALGVEDLRNYLKERLPEYMVPLAFVTLEQLPLTPNGKVDRRALPAPDWGHTERETGYVAPRTAVEKALASIWEQVLGVARVSADSNFFELGGDSILIFQVIARATESGIRMKPKQVFQHQTLAELAGVVEVLSTGDGRVEAEARPDTGPLTPIQRWFFEQEFAEEHHWNQDSLLQVRPGVDPDVLETALQALVNHHEILRARFTRTASGWVQTVAATADVPLTRIDLSRLPADRQSDAIAETAAQTQASLDFTAGQVMKAVHFDLGAGQPSRLLLVIHHLAVDGVSWRILLEDLQALCEQLSRGQEPRLARTTAFMRWAQRLEEYAGSGALDREAEYWLNRPVNPADRIPVDFPAGANTNALMRSVSAELTVEETHALLHDVPGVYHTQINDVLLTALTQAFAKWTGRHSLLVALESHGRAEVLEGVDLSRTVGWFTAMYPISLDLTQARTPGDGLKAIKEQLSRVPHQGIGYGLLRYMTGHGERLRTLPTPQVSFNYLGQFDQVMNSEALFNTAPEASGPAQSPAAHRSHLLDVTGVISQGRLSFAWFYSEKVHHKSTVQFLCNAYMTELRALIAHCKSAEAGGFTPSDFGRAKLNQKQLDKLLSKLGK